MFLGNKTAEIALSYLASSILGPVYHLSVHTTFANREQQVPQIRKTVRRRVENSDRQLEIIWRVNSKLPRVGEPFEPANTHESIDSALTRSKPPRVHGSSATFLIRSTWYC